MNSQKFYSKIAGFYNFGLWIIGYKGAVNYVMEQLPLAINDSFKVLDVGCGTGLYSIAVLKKFPNSQIVAFDLNSEMVEDMRRNLKQQNLEGRARVFVGDALDSIAEKNDFKLIITGGLLEYVDIQKAVVNLSHYLCGGGYFLNSPVKNNILGNFIGKLSGFKPYSKQVNISVFTQNGFELQKIIKLPFRYFPICLVKEAHLFIFKRK